MKINRNVDVLVGLTHGDEGKGKILNELCSDYHITVRYNGGANSGHTCFDKNGNKVIFNLVPSGMLNEEIVGVLTQGVVLNPLAFTQEVARVGLSAPNLRERLVLSGDINLTLPSHILIDIFTEKFRSKTGDIIGSTMRGNTPTYIDKVARRGMRLKDIFNSSLESLVDVHINSHVNQICGTYGYTAEEVYAESINGMPFQQYVDLWIHAAEDLKKFTILNTVHYLHKCIKEGKKMLVEGAQGLMLDIDYGTYPFVTSSSVTASSAFAQTGIPVQCVNKVFGVTKLYVTRVGNGFFPSECKENNELDWKFSERVVETGKEFGSVTGRKRKIGYLDIPQLKYACAINGVTDLILMKCDILSDMPFSIVETYKYKGDKELCDIYRGDADFEHCTSLTFKPLGEISIDNERVADLIDYIEDRLSDIITSPKVSYISSSPIASAIKIR